MERHIIRVRCVMFWGNWKETEPRGGKDRDGERREGIGREKENRDRHGEKG